MLKVLAHSTGSMFNDGVTADILTGEAGTSEKLRQYYPALDKDVQLQKANIPSSVARWFPIPRLTRNFPKTLLLHGEEDIAIKFEDSEIFDRQLKSLGVESRFILVQGEGSGHGFERQHYEKFWAPYMAESLQWLFDSL